MAKSTYKAGAMKNPANKSPKAAPFKKGGAKKMGKKK